VLPEGAFALTLGELRTSTLVKGPRPDSPYWGAHRVADGRRKLADNLEVFVRELWEVGVPEIFIDGSFLEDEDHPNGIDGSFGCDWRELVSGALQDRLNQPDPHRPGLITSHDSRGNPLESPAFFRTSRRPLRSGATQKWIVEIRRQP
jgi:hypothetical protein